MHLGQFRRELVTRDHLGAFDGSLTSKRSGNHLTHRVVAAQRIP